MKKLYLIILSSLIICGLLAFITQNKPGKTSPKKTSGAAQALDAWAFARAYPGTELSMTQFQRSWEFKKRQEAHAIETRSDQAAWEAIGPKNIGGRTLALAFNPQNPQTLYAGSASGGLWRSYTAGVGVEAWHQVKTGFPVLGVSTIAFHPQDSNIIYIGTGEVYNYQNTAPGVSNRITRGTYGIGILKSEDGGNTWTKSLDWAYGDLRGINEILVNPQRPATIYAATSEGLYRTYNGGGTWTMIHPILMAMDIEMIPGDTSKLLVSHGNLNTNGNGIYRSLNGGGSFTKLTNGLPNSFSGKTMLDVSASNPNLIYASVANDFNSMGLYQSTNGGNSWISVNSEDVAKYQGWYSHDIAVHPNNSSELIYVGIDTWKSTNGGNTLAQKSYWSNWYFGVTPVGGPEGPADYVHADIHAIYYHPQDPNQVFLATDGGIFHSNDAGETFSGRNGGYQTTQFYANFSNSVTDSAYAMGGMQDNATAIYEGNDAWKRVIGGDGLSSSIHPLDDDTIFGSYQYLGMARSYNRGDNFEFIVPPGGNGALPTNFAAPFELAPGDPNRIYAGRNFLFRSDDLGSNWTQTSSSPIDGNNPILTLAVSEQNPNHLYVGTAPNGAEPGIFRTFDAGVSWFKIDDGLPNRMPMDIALHPQDDNIAYVVYAGFGTPHVYRTTSGAPPWQSLSQGLPDVPTNTIVIDPIYPQHVYVGNDLGVYLSRDGGDTWEIFCAGLPDITLVMHLSISPANRKLRVATHGNGVFESPLAEPEATSIDLLKAKARVMGQNYPNPVTDITSIPIRVDKPLLISIDLIDMQGRAIRQLVESSRIYEAKDLTIDLTDLPAGRYLYQLKGKVEGSGRVWQETRILVKK
jgi:photosystem II stability/assembly factor-like uncharacterized protein